MDSLSLEAEMMISSLRMERWRIEMGDDDVLIWILWGRLSSDSSGSIGVLWLCWSLLELSAITSTNPCKWVFHLILILASARYSEKSMASGMLVILCYKVMLYCNLWDYLQNAWSVTSFLALSEECWPFMLGVACLFFFFLNAFVFQCFLPSRLWLCGYFKETVVQVLLS